MTAFDEMQVLLGPELAHKALTYVTGSHAIGLDTPESDTDLTAIYWDWKDDRRVFRQYPEVKHSTGNDLKVYGLRKFAELLVKGNPNNCEMVALTPEPALPRSTGAYNRAVLTSFMQAVKPHLATRHVAAAYLGHLQHLHGEIQRGKMPEPKRVSHGYRLAVSASELLKTGRVPKFKDMAYDRSLAMQIKMGWISIEEGMALLRQADAEAGALYKDNTLPDATALREAINEFFIEGVG